MRNRATLAGVALSAVAALWLTYGYAGAQEVVEGIRTARTSASPSS